MARAVEKSVRVGGLLEREGGWSVTTAATAVAIKMSHPSDISHVLRGTDTELS